MTASKERVYNTVEWVFHSENRLFSQYLKGIVNFSEDNGVSMESLVAIGCDGTNVNTGSKGGLITLMENIWGGHFTGPFVCCMRMSYLCDTCSLN